MALVSVSSETAADQHRRQSTFAAAAERRRGIGCLVGKRVRVGTVLEEQLDHVCTRVRDRSVERRTRRMRARADFSAHLDVRSAERVQVVRRCCLQARGEHAVTASLALHVCTPVSRNSRDQGLVN